MPTRVSSGSTLALLGAWVLLFVGILYDLTPVTVAIGIPLALVMPGHLLLQLLRPRVSRLEWWTLAVAGSIGAFVLSVGLASLLPSGITRISAAGVLGASTAVLLVLRAVLVRRGVLDSGPVPLRALESVRVPSGRQLLAWGASGVVVAVALTLAFWISVSTERSLAEEPLTQLSLTRTGDAGSYNLQVVNLEGRETSYRLEVQLPGADLSTRTIAIGDEEVFRETLRPAAGDVVVRLYGGTVRDPGYRQVEITTQ